ncbi:replication protein RepA [Microbacterium foliorum]|uniref:replication protein RepA n=1 Tax=Rothia terrae TaxID=396015 RepID=UPI0034253638
MNTLHLAHSNHDVIFLPKDLIRFSLPYRDTGQSHWLRENGQTEYAVHAGRILDVKTGQMRTLLPSGKIARLILIWFCTQAKITKNKKIEVRPSMRQLLKDLGVPWSSANALEVSNQLQALLNCTLQLTELENVDGQQKVVTRNLLVSDSSKLWFLNGEIESKNLSYVFLSDSLYEELHDAVPISNQACRYLQQTSKSPMALDVYFWLCLRLYHRARPSRVTWEQLYLQFGSNADKHKFKQVFRKSLEKVQEVYPQARIVEVGEDGRSRQGFQGFMLYPSPDPRENFQDQLMSG